jgi:hypothetical protein
LNLDILRRAETAIAEHRQRAEVLAAENAGLASRIAAIDIHSQVLEKPLGAKERDSLYRLLLAMAVKKYHYRPAALRNSATTRIASDLVELGLRLDEDTIRKYLTEAKELLPRDPSEGD